MCRDFANITFFQQSLKEHHFSIEIILEDLPQGENSENMNVFIEKSNKTISVRKAYKKASDLVKELGINPDSIIIIRNNAVILSEDPLSAKDDIQLLSVVSGG
jgi:sulfur carrier protein ThiS